MKGRVNEGRSEGRSDRHADKSHLRGSTHITTRMYTLRFRTLTRADEPVTLYAYVQIKKLYIKNNIR